MLIQCTSCKATARLSDEKEGAKVRCPSCGHIYVARPTGSRGSTRAKSNNTQLMVFGGVGIVAVIMMAVVMSGGDPAPTSKVEELPELIEDLVTADLTGWDSPLVMAARTIHKTAYQKERFKLQRHLAMNRIYARVKTTEEREVIPGDWAVLSKEDQILFEEELIETLFDDSIENLVAAWKPFDGKVELEADDVAKVRITLEPRDAELGVQTRSVDWLFVKEGDKWLAWSWERFISDSELRGQLVARVSSTKKITLSDGSLVLEAEPGPLGWMPGTTAGERAQIEKLIATVCSPDTRGPDVYRARAELIAICKPAIPPLLTKFYELNLVGFDTYENQVASMQLHKILTEITKYNTTFKAHEALGATNERRSSGVKQWFSWYHRKFERWEECDTMTTPEEEEELLFEPANDQERRDLERALREAAND